MKRKLIIGTGILLLPICLAACRHKAEVIAGQINEPQKKANSTDKENVVENCEGEKKVFSKTTPAHLRRKAQRI